MAPKIEARLLRPSEREQVLDYLARDSRENLFLLDLTTRQGVTQGVGELPTEIACAWQGSSLVGVVGLRPSVVFDSAVSEEVLEAFFPFLEPLRIGLVKSSAPIVDLLWDRLSRRRRRRTVVDRIETAYVLPADVNFGAEGSTPTAGRPASIDDLEPLVIAARESLREEGRPDPFAGDIMSFRRWVEGRVSRARVVEHRGSVCFVAYADVQRTQGWLVQGVYTWPAARRQGLAREGMTDLCREAFAAGADHVQLALVDGNEAGRGLYEGLGFKPIGKLRTILFN
jgi:ribosomal protein S18 acetylase RimI-like enzyme